LQPAKVAANVSPSLRSSNEWGKGQGEVPLQPDLHFRYCASLSFGGQAFSCIDKLRGYFPSCRAGMAKPPDGMSFFCFAGIMALGHDDTIQRE